MILIQWIECLNFSLTLSENENIELPYLEPTADIPSFSQRITKDNGIMLNEAPKNKYGYKLVDNNRVFYGIKTEDNRVKDAFKLYNIL